MVNLKAIVQIYSEQTDFKKLGRTCTIDRQLLLRYLMPTSPSFFEK